MAMSDEMTQAAKAQNHIFDSLGKQYGLQIIPGANSFLVLLNNISWSTAVGAILHPGGPAHAPLSGRSAWMSNDLAMESGDNLAFVLAVSGDEKLLCRLNELDTAQTTCGANMDIGHSPRRIHVPYNPLLSNRWIRKSHLFSGRNMVSFREYLVLHNDQCDNSILGAVLLRSTNTWIMSQAIQVVDDFHYHSSCPVPT
ncbi:hypothetical protein EDD18DRAFT_1357531 [Armillaria luteobubalina]|uniref:Uncharacterized protein n=1 Tax=Armillaria luteobubalina TaxID=153913 RepID=A0AA39PZV0_9AGAR|nr:hypothetical protein EDD18DRAFT_1357531 [Armillaria luteobubalina]